MNKDYKTLLEYSVKEINSLKECIETALKGVENKELHKTAYVISLIHLINNDEVLEIFRDMMTKTISVIAMRDEFRNIFSEIEDIVEKEDNLEQIEYESKIH